MFPDYQWHSLALPPRFFRWRIRGNPVSWLNEPCFREQWDLVIATSMVDLAALKGFHPAIAETPCLLYMHENQFAFPASGKQRSSAEPQVVNLYSAIAADRIVFNSAWNRDSFMRGARDFLDKMPDGVPDGLIDRLQAKSGVIPVPIEDALFAERTHSYDWQCPHLLWNHRWEYDKGPERLLALLEVLDQRKLSFRLSVVGEGFRKHPPAFDRIYEHFSDRIVNWGFLAQRADYDRLLQQADVVISTALHDFQGLSMLEAMAAGCIALAPDRLAYREYVPDRNRYSSHEQGIEAEASATADCLESLLRESPEPSLPDPWRASVLAEHYRSVVDALIRTDCVNR